MNRKGPAVEPRLVGAERVRAVLRGFLLDNLVYKILSLVLSLAVWGWVQGQLEVEETTWAQVSYRLPDDLAFAQPPVSRVRVTLAGAQGVIREAKQRDLTIAVDLTQYPEGAHSLDFLGYEVQGLPEALRTMGLVPPTFDIQLVPKVRRRVVLKPVQVGEPAEGYRVKSIRLVPPEIEVEGPATSVEEVRDGLSIEAISVAGIDATVTRKVQITLPNRTLARIDREPVEAEVVVEPVTSTRSVDEVPVFSRSRQWRPSRDTVTVTLVGPIRTLEELDSQAVIVQVIVPEDVPAKPFTVGLEPKAAARVEVVGLPDGVSAESISPARFEVEPAP